MALWSWSLIVVELTEITLHNCYQVFVASLLSQGERRLIIFTSLVRAAESLLRDTSAVIGMGKVGV